MMEVVMTTRQQTKGIESEVVDLRGFDFSPRTVVKVERAADDGKKKVEKNVEPMCIDFSLGAPSGNHPLTKLMKKVTGDHTPDSLVSLRLRGNEKGGLDLDVRYDWTHRYTAYRQEGCGSLRVTDVGDEVAPYCYATERSIDYERYESVPYEATERKYYNNTFRNVKGPEFAAVFLALSEAAKGDKDVVPALSALDKSYPALTAEARGLIGESRDAIIADKVQELRALQESLAAI